MSPPLTILIVHHDQIDALHCDFLIDALNRQTSQNFNTFWINQVPDGGPLAAKLSQQANFVWQLFNIQHPVVAGVVCWDLIGIFALLMEHPEMGKWFSYLHLECLPETSLVQHLLEVLPAIEADYGPRTICMLHQLWCGMTVDELDARHYFEQLRLADTRLWQRKIPYEVYKQSLSFAYWEYRWEEDAFVMSSALARDLRLYSAVREPLFFQDVFDIFVDLAKQSYASDLRWIRIQNAIVYHLSHPRLFREYRRDFLDAVRDLPELFGHLAHYEMAQTDKFYLENEEMRLGKYNHATLQDFYSTLRYSANGTVTLWQRYLDQAHGVDHGVDHVIRPG